jgi:hypothetical protein
MTAETIAKVLGGRKAGGGWMVCCPAHGDGASNLSIRDTDGGKVLVRCHAGCDQERVIAALRSLGLWEEHVDPAGSRAPRLVPLPATARIKAAPSMSRVVDGYPMPRRSSGKPLPGASAATTSAGSRRHGPIRYRRSLDYLPFIRTPCCGGSRKA